MFSIVVGSVNRSIVFDNFELLTEYLQMRKKDAWIKPQKQKNPHHNLL